ncbi:phenylpyruvate tautomerase MIF-related protein [Verrucomicrobiales bacterium]|jgi:phenylpyruvate tautomerase PptA (4-oxalocrotonate tautomerase family)|nr:phenylpyruvate tautomerase MIF-related protein [Verrucomicrobiales bacterium]|tara:strand:- start:329 stop:673 length:345 start_codon:yes stop_codon:yes gene_type:complete
MPLIQIRTNVPLSEEATNELLKKATTIAARELGKPESIMMATASTGAPMLFGGTDGPTALFEIEGIELSSDPANALCLALSELAEAELQAPADRVFVKLTNVPRGNWAGNRKVY